MADRMRRHTAILDTAADEKQITDMREAQKETGEAVPEWKRPDSSYAARRQILALRRDGRGPAAGSPVARKHWRSAVTAIAAVGAFARAPKQSAVEHIVYGAHGRGGGKRHSLINPEDVRADMREAQQQSLIGSLRDHHGIDSSTAGDSAEHYTDQSLLQRDSMRFAPRVLATLDKLWDIVDENHDGVVSQQEYTKMYLVLHKALQGAAPRIQVQHLAAQDWQRDTGGREVMDRPLFRASFFEIADLWTESISETAYVAFLEFIVATISISGCLLQASSVKKVSRRQSALFFEKFKRAEELERQRQQKAEQEQGEDGQPSTARDVQAASQESLPGDTAGVVGGDYGGTRRAPSLVLDAPGQALVQSQSPQPWRLGSPGIAERPGSPGAQSVQSVLRSRLNSSARGNGLSPCLWRPPSLLQARRINRFVR